MDPATPPPNSIQNPIHGTTIDTSPSELGLSRSHASAPLSDSHDSADESDDGGKSILKRTVEKLGRNTSLSRSKRQADSDAGRGHRRIFSLSRHKGKDRAAEEVAGVLAGHTAGSGTNDSNSGTIHQSLMRTSKLIVYIGDSPQKLAGSLLNPSPKTSPRVSRMAATTSDIRRNKSQATSSRPSLSITGKQDEFGVGSVRFLIDSVNVLLN